MSSRTTDLDARRNAFRPDLADVRLEGQVTAKRFVAGTPKQLRAVAAPLYTVAEAGRGLDSEVLFGETLNVFDETSGWAWVQLDRDGYVGYVPAAALSGDIIAATHRIKSRATFIYPDANIKRTPMGQLSLGAMVTVSDASARFSKLATGGFVISRHLAAIDAHARDFVDIAEGLIHTPYLWGGRTHAGVDCSGLVQLSLEAAGHKCPRDSDMQAAELGENVLVPGDLEGLKRGDLIFWPGHVGILIDGVMLLHANGHHMSTVIEPLTQATRRILKGDGSTSVPGPGISAIRRLTATS